MTHDDGEKPWYGLEKEAGPAFGKALDDFYGAYFERAETGERGVYQSH